MAGHSRTRAQRATRSTQYAPLPPEVDRARDAALFFARDRLGAGPEDDESRELAHTVAHKARLARMAETAAAADAILHPGEGESVSAEIMRAGFDGLGAITDKALAAEAAARASADSERKRVDEARHEGAQQAQQAVAAQNGVLEKAITSAWEQVGKISADTRAMADRAIDAERGRNSDLVAMTKPFVDLAATLAARALQPADATKQTQGMDFLGFLTMMGEFQKILPAQQPGESAADYERRKMTDARVVAWETQNKANSDAMKAFMSFLDANAGPLLQGVGHLLQSRFGGAAAGLGPLPAADSIVPGGGA